MQPSFAVAVTGPDRWLRPMLVQRLSSTGLIVNDIASGAASVRGYEALVYLPPMMPSASPAQDLGSTQARITFAAAAEGRVSRIVVVSRVGPDRAANPYLEALRAIESSAAQMSARVTVVRAAHPIGTGADAGPVADALRAIAPGAGPGPIVQPVAVEDLLDVVEAAVEGRIGAGVVEVGGPVKMPLASLRDLVAPAAERGPRLRRVWRPGRRKAAEAAARFLALESVPSVRLSSPLAAPARDVQHA